MPVTPETLQLVAAARQAVADITDNVTRTLATAWVTAWDQLALDLLLALDDLIATTTEGGGWPTRARIDRAARLQQALDAVAKALDELTQTVRAQAAAAAHSTASAGATTQAGIIASQLPPAGSRAVVLSQLTRWSERDLAAIVDRATQQITALTKPLTAEATAAMKRELVRGVAVGEHPHEAARRMLQRLEGEFNGGLVRAFNIARTEMLDAHRQAARMAQAANADVLNGWVWMASLGRNSCAACWAMHGTEHPASEPGPQGHQQCRCSRTPLVKPWKDLGINVPEPPSVIPDAEQAFRAMSREDQLRVMGPGRLAAYERGDAAWADLATRRDNPGWRPSYVPTPVGQLT
ncbi:phage minor head protein [Microbispora amethystogenes]|uniref:phage minor head protein n=1 Tax=Microbispora amethystogenes TaxID=1427754 RepID=UPI003406D292